MLSRRPWLRGLQIVVEFGAFGWAWFRLRRREPDRLPERLRIMLERLGTTFVKLGQGLSLRRDLLPPQYQEALGQLTDRVAPFASDQAVGIVEHAFGQPVTSLFAEFDRVPFAAASVAQMHRARMPDGSQVAVKVRRPGIVRQVHSDLRLLRWLVRLVQGFAPGLRRQRPLELINELGRQLLAEIDLNHEARNMRRLEAAFAGHPDLTMPAVVEPYVSADVLVQQFSDGTPVVAEAGSARGAVLAAHILDAYLYQLFEAGVFHADPHPGNLFVMPDGRLCFHDFGLIGYLDIPERQALALLLEAVASTDASGTLDAAVALGVIVLPFDRRGMARGIGEILDELRTARLAEWSLAETLWRIARLGHGEHFRLPRHLLVLLRALFLAEHSIRTLDPSFDLLGELNQRRESVARSLDGIAGDGSKRSLTERLARTAHALPAVVTELLRDAQREDGRLSLAMHHRGLEEIELHLSRTGNRLSLAIVILGLYVAGSVLMLHSAGPRIWGDVPVIALAVFSVALVLSARLVIAIHRSGRF